MSEEVRRLFDRLPDETLRLVALLRLEGYANDEIAASLDCALRSVERKLERIRVHWSEESYRPTFPDLPVPPEETSTGSAVPTAGPR
jgi:DNA-directed RNA polymerase specialized sigma24 family protein